ncbi:peptidoglycan hydrolase FlgJ [Ruminiclostridium hungatei]|uniref:Peptidoglycan hydrolase FlgJ n=1 Tax=Ruminiclostridium hungatei TaxID=48256 RepID=A0A1V4SIT1_RUMHU|nr:rod-binding protein [Ruminiclostridium hungatei]OPX43802.1 peptidoglycan hydrolase FlgJ [Ruminiclostridium hungatei]
MGIGGIDVNAKSLVDSAQVNRTGAKADSFEKRLKEAAQKGDDAQLKQVCKEFEGIFLNMMYKQMKATVPKSDYLQSDYGTEMYDTMMDETLVEVMSQKGIGLGDYMYKQLARQYLKTDSSEEASGGVVDEKK